MVSKLLNDTKYFFERLFAKDGAPLLMLTIIAVVLGVLEAMFFVFLIRNSTQLNIPFLLLYTYGLYFINRALIRTIQFFLSRFNILNYQVDNFNYLDNDINSKIRRYNNSIYIKEKDRYEATIIYILTIVIFMFIILTFVLNADKILKIILVIILLIPFLIMVREPYEIITLDVNLDDLREMQKKDFFEKFLDTIFQEKQIISPVDLPGESIVEPNYQEQQYIEQYVEQQTTGEQYQDYNQNYNNGEYQDYNQNYNNEDYQDYNQNYNNGEYQNYNNNQNYDNGEYQNYNQNYNNNQQEQEITGQWWQQ